MKAMKVAQIPLTYPIHWERLQHGTCFIWSSSCHTVQYTTNSPNQCADAYPSVQQTATLQTAFQNVQKMMRGLPDSTSRWWTLDLQGNTWKDIMYSWAWSTIWIMSIPMPLCKLSDSFLHEQFGFKWYNLDYEDYMVTSSDEDIPAFGDTPYWEMLWYDLNSIWFI